VDGGVAYFTVGLFSFEGAYVCALDAVSGKEIWKREIPNLTPQGYLLASKDRLYVPTGRGEPFVLNREDGEFLYAVEGAGGTFCLLSEDVLIYGPGKQGTFEAFKPDDKEEIATFQGNTMIVTPDRSFLHTDTELTAIDRKKYMQISEERAMLTRKHRELREELKKISNKESEEAVALQKQITEIEAKSPDMDRRLAECLLWKKECHYPYSLVEAGDGKLFAGGYKSVAAFDATSGEMAWSAPVAGRALDIAVSEGKLIVSTDEGTIHCFAKP
jgi:outer membrane protein assembly factor BamB